MNTGSPDEARPRSDQVMSGSPGFHEPLSATVLGGLDARVKVLCTVVWVICVASLSRGALAAYGVYAGLLGAVLVGQPGTLRPTLRRLASVLPVIVLLVLSLPVFVPGETALALGGLRLSRPGAFAALHVGCVALLCVTAVALLSATTRQDALLSALRSLGVPGALVEVLGFMARYLDVVRPEMQRLRDARAARTIAVRRYAAPRATAGVLGSGLLRAWDRAERVADAMAARGYTGQRRALAPTPLKTRDVLVGVVFVALAVSVRWAVGR